MTYVARCADDRSYGSGDTSLWVLLRLFVGELTGQALFRHHIVKLLLTSREIGDRFLAGAADAVATDGS